MESVLGQTYQDFEVLLMDDCSTDESRSIISEYKDNPRIRVELNEENSGSPFKQWNKGVRLAEGKYIWIAESDDYADQRLLERLVNVLDAEPNVTFAYCRSRRIGANGEPNGYADLYLADLEPAGRWTADFRADGREECANYFVHINSVPNASAVVFRKEAYERLGGADERLRVCGDWKLWAAMALQGKVAYVSEPLNFFREHEGTVRNKMQESGRGAEEHLGMLAWMLEQVTPTEAILEKAYLWASYLWVPAVFSWRVPLRLRWVLLRHAMATDPHAIERLLAPIVAPVRLKLAKHWRVARRKFLGHTK